jgi:DNA-binding PadR family transcriptional regulator
MKGSYLGELEELVLLVVAAHEDLAYGVGIMEFLKKEIGRDLNISAVHAVLKRLEAKGMLTSSMSAPTAARGGRRKRIFSITKVGAEALDASNAIRSNLYSQVPKFSYSTI